MNISAAIQVGIAVQFVYDKWNSGPGPVDLNGVLVPTNGQTYKVIRTIYANNLATAIKPVVFEYTTMGIVAQNVADATDIYIAIRGTSDIWDWIQDLKFLQTAFTPVSGAGFTEDGFTAMYLSFSLAPAPSVTNFVQEIYALLTPGVKTNVTVAGHSLGAALATLLTLDMSANAPPTSLAQVALYTFASPRVGDQTFMNLFNHIVPDAYRIHNRLDIVTKTPPPFFYFHVGDETELVPSPDMKFDLLCEHHMGSYLNMLAALISLAGFPIPPDCLKNAPGAG